MTNLYQKVNMKFDRRTITAADVNHIWCIDLVDFNTPELGNSGYILNCVDVFSRYAQAVKLSHKNKASIQEGLQQLFILYNAKPKLIWSDLEAGVESHLVQDWLKEQNIGSYSVNNSYKGAGTHSVSIVERFNRTMKEKMFQYKTEQKPMNFIQLMNYTIKHFIPYYNNVEHSTLKAKPSDIYFKDVNKNEIYMQQQKRENEKKDEVKKVYEVGTRVHLQKPPEVIRGKKETNYYKKVDIIESVKETNPITYTLVGRGDTGYYPKQFILASKEEIESDDDTDIESVDNEYVEPFEQNKLPRRSMRLAHQKEPDRIETLFKSVEKAPPRRSLRLALKNI